MPRFDVTSMLEEDEAVKGLDIPFRFGKGFDVNYSLKDGNWINTNNGRIWSLSVQSEGAYSINFIFSQLFLPTGGELYIYNTEGTMVYGPVTSKQNLKERKFLTDLIRGDAVIIYIFEPEKEKGKTRLTISRIVHAYVDTYRSSNFGLKSAALNCHNNVDCSPNWEDESDGVALILLSSGTEHCTGGLLNNTANDYTPNILTAFHCIDASQNGALSATEITNAESWLFKFGFRINDCGGMSYSALTFNGANYLSGWVESDFALLEMDDSPVGHGNITFLGWDNRDNAPTSGTVIHHPAGDYMKISFDTNSLATNGLVIDWDLGPDSPYSTHWIAGLDNGAIEQGSSGAPLFDQNSRVVGQLHGGYIQCPPATVYFGQFNVSWEGNNTDITQLANWLDPNDTADSTTNLLRSPSITVPDEICYSGTTVSMQNPPSGVTITWGGDNVYYPVNTGTSVTVRAASSSTASLGTVTASFTVNGHLRTITQTIWAGKVEEDDIVASTSGQGPAGPCSEVHSLWDDGSTVVVAGHVSDCPNDPDDGENIFAAESILEFDWDLESGWDWMSTGNGYVDNAEVEISSDWGTYPSVGDYVEIGVRARNCSGWSNWEYNYWQVVSGGGGMYMVLSPNPSSGETEIVLEAKEEEIALKSASKKTAFDENEEWEYEVYSIMQKLKAKKTKIRGKSTTLNTQGWEEGVYTVRAKYKDQVLTGKLLVK